MTSLGQTAVKFEIRCGILLSRGKGLNLPPLLKAMPGSLTTPGEPSPSPGLRGEQAKPTSVTRPCGSGPTPLHGRLDRADVPFLRSNAEIFLNSSRSFARYTPAVPDDLLQRCTAGHLALHHQVTEQKGRLEEEHFFFVLFVL